jgi:hypothetical protein
MAALVKAADIVFQQAFTGRLFACDYGATLGSF